MALIETADLWKTYEMGSEQVHALSGVSIQIERGEYVAIMGPSGSGKSTLMNLIGCLDTPTKGSYLLNGKQVGQMNDDELARIRNEEIGFVFQTFNLLPRATALHNVELPLIYAGISGKLRSERATQALHKVELADRMLHRPNQLSGGQRHLHVLQRGAVGQEVEALEDEADALSPVRHEAAGGRFGDVLAVHPDFARGRPVKPADQVEQGRLARAGRPNERHGLAARYLKVDAIHGGYDRRPHPVLPGEAHQPDYRLFVGSDSHR